MANPDRPAPDGASERPAPDGASDRPAPDGASQKSARRWSRRAVVAGGGLLALGGAGLLARPGVRGGPHDAYFSRLSAALHRAGVARPVLVVDTTRLARNITAVRQTLAGTGLNLRLVVKSLPAPALLETIADGTGTRRMMVFNGPMLQDVAQHWPDADVLLGKPLPVDAARAFLAATGDPAAPAANPQWLIDTPERLAQYAALARGLGRPLRVNFEIDVGLHRGGIASPAALAAMVDAAREESMLSIAGLMGYDPHVPKMPSPDSAFKDSQAAYAEAIAVLRERLGGSPERWTLNGAGSPTYALHARGSVVNDVAVGSGFVKPGDFDLDTLRHHVPAAFIATPVLKATGPTRLPGLEPLGGLLRWLDPNSARAFFIHGGHWLATPVSPPGLQYNSLFGRSSNQEMLTGSARVTLQPDDYVFLRPSQSEALFFQFGPLVTYDGREIAGRWETFSVSA